MLQYRQRGLLLVMTLAVLLCLLAACQNAEPLEPDNEAATVITVGTLFGREIDSITRIARDFNESQDQIRVEVVSFFRPGQDDVSSEEQRMYAAFTTGDTPDLYYMLSMDAAKLRNAGLITDWYSVMEADPSFDMSDYQTHIWEALETDGALYQLCISYVLWGLGGPAELYDGHSGWTLDEFTAFLAENGDSLGVGQERMLQIMLWYGTQFEFVDPVSKTCNFQTQAFYDYLAFLKALPEHWPSSQEIQLGRIGGPYTHGSNWKINGYYPRVSGLPSQERTGAGINIDDSFALASDTEKTDACWAFLKWMLSEEYQVEICASIPLHKGAWEEQLRRAALDGSDEESLFAGNHMPGGKYQPGLPEEEIAYLRESAANAEYVSLGFFDYEDVTAIVEEEILAYLAGDKSAEECAHLIQERVSIMLAEMQS